MSSSLAVSVAVASQSLKSLVTRRIHSSEVKEWEASDRCRRSRKRIGLPERRPCTVQSKPQAGGVPTAHAIGPVQKRHRVGSRAKGRGAVRCRIVVSCLYDISGDDSPNLPDCASLHGLTSGCGAEAALELKIGRVDTHIT
jgi:hypothetical protein